MAAVVVMTVMIVAVQIAALSVSARLLGSEAYQRGVADATLASPVMLLSTLLTQVQLIAMLWIAAGRGGLRRPTLQLAQAPFGWGASLVSGLAIVSILAVLQIVLHTFAPGYDLTRDARSFVNGLQSPLWWGTLIAIGCLAPISEELLARGFLLSALANSRLGIAGAGLVSNILWTGLHFQYSWPSLLTVFCGGVLLTCLVWRTGSLRAAVVAHTVVNAAVLSYLAIVSQS